MGEIGGSTVMELQGTIRIDEKELYEKLLSTITFYGYTLSEIKKIIDFARQHGYEDKE